MIILDLIVRAMLIVGLVIGLKSIIEDIKNDELKDFFR